MGLHGGHRMTSTAMIDQHEKSHQGAESLVSWPYYSEFAATTTMHHTTMMYQINRCKEATDLARRLPQRWLGSRPSWLVGACLLANFPSKTRSQQHNCVCQCIATKMANNGHYGTATMVPHLRHQRIQQSPRMLVDCTLWWSQE